MDKLINYMSARLAVANRYPEYARTNFDQAFGALCYHIELNPSDEDKLIPLWEHTYRPSFETIIYAPIKELSKRDDEWRPKPGNPFI